MPELHFVQKQHFNEKKLLNCIWKDMKSSRINAIEEWSRSSAIMRRISPESASGGSILTAVNLHLLYRKCGQHVRSIGWPVMMDEHEQYVILMGGTRPKLIASRGGMHLVMIYYMNCTPVIILVQCNLFEFDNSAHMWRKSDDCVRYCLFHLKQTLEKKLKSIKND